MPAVLVALVLLGAIGITFRTLDASINSGGRRLPPGTLAHIPKEIGDWSGQDEPVDERVRKATDTDDLLNRRYTRGSDGATVGLYVAYGARARDLAPHRPEVCYPSAGWILQEKKKSQLALPTGEQPECRIMRFSQGGFELRSIIVVNYYIVDDEFSPDVEVLRAKAAFGSSGIDYMAQVQVSAMTSPLRDTLRTEQLALDFAKESAGRIQSVLMEAKRGTDDDSPANTPSSVTGP